MPNVRFTSGAAAADMSGQAARSFGWPRECADQREHARAQFPPSRTEIPGRGTGPSFEPGRHAAIAEPTGTGE
jgi:hypothetical protein